MPITSSAKKALRQTKKKTVRNIKRKKAFRSVVKDFKKAIEAKEFDRAKELLPKVYKTLDKASKHNTIHKNKAARMKSRISKKIPNSTSTPAA